VEVVGQSSQTITTVLHPVVRVCPRTPPTHSAPRQHHTSSAFDPRPPSRSRIRKDGRAERRFSTHLCNRRRKSLSLVHRTRRGNSPNSVVPSRCSQANATTHSAPCQKKAVRYGKGWKRRAALVVGMCIYAHARICMTAEAPCIRE
jgi:hypothetical protein